ncbi:MAG: leucine-rich repeat protein, partial [Oscillospiraceae bacterium]|nr:leucine-rich repeat protein [Oscillospiraceae bacterium]
KTLSQDWRIGSSGSYTLTAYAYRSTADANGRYEKEYPGSYKRMIGTEDVTVTAPNGPLAAPVLTGIPTVMYSGDGINGTIGLDEHSEHVRIYMYMDDPDSGSLNILDIDEDVAQTTIPLVIDAETLKPGEYRLQVCSEAYGYEETILDKSILVEAIEGSNRKSLILTVDGSSADIPEYPANKGIKIAVTAPVINDSVPTNVRFLKDNAPPWQMWEQGVRNEQDRSVFTWETGFDSGIYSLYAQASYDGGLTWPVDSNIVTVNMVSRGQTKAVKLDLLEQNVTDGLPLTVKVNLPEDAAGVVPTEVDLQIVNPDGSNRFNCGHAYRGELCEEDFPFTIQISTDGIGPGTFAVNALTSADWYNGSSSLSDPFTVDPAVTEGTLGGLEWEIVDRHLLNISGSGVIPDFANATAAPWYPFASAITRVRMESNVTGIGSYAFAGFGLEHALRVEFNQATRPTIADNAFSGSKAICRYYANDASYDQAGKYGGTLEWIYLPVSNQDGNPLTLTYCGSFANPSGWAVGYTPETGGDYQYASITPTQAKELTYRNRWIDFRAIPTTPEDLSVIEDRLDPDTSVGLHFGEECVGSFILDLSSTSKLGSIDMHAPGLTLTVSDPRTSNCFGRLLLTDGTVTYNGNIMDVYLKNPWYGHSGPSLTVNGNVDILNFYGPTSDTPYSGDLTVHGTIAKGVVYGAGTIDIPNIADNIPLGEVMTMTLTNVNQVEPVVVNGQLNVQGTDPVGKLDISMFKLDYRLSSDGWSLLLDPRDVSGAYSVGINNVLDYNPSFTADDIVYGEDNQLSVYEPGKYGPVVLNGGTDSNGRPLGLRQVTVTGCDLTVNCPVDYILAYRYQSNPTASSIKINAPVESLNIDFKLPGDTVRLLAGGSVRYGQWSRDYVSNRYFGPVSGPCEIWNDQLCVFSWKDGELTQVILPSEAVLADAAGLGEGQTAQMEVSDSSVNALEAAEQTSLEAYLADTGLDLGDVASVFDVSISAFSMDANGEYMPDGVITELNQAVNLSVRNTAEGESQVVRLHENNDGTVTATAVSALTAGDEISFTSDLFSKYAIVPSAKPVWNKTVYTWAADNSSVTARRTSRVTPGLEETETAAAAYELLSSPTQTSQGTVRLTSAAFQNPAFKVQSKEVRIPALGNMQVLSLPGNLSSIEEEAFMGGAFEAVIVPAGCTDIGNRAFADCTSLIFIRIPGDSTTVSDTAFEGCGMVIIDRTPLS